MGKIVELHRRYFTDKDVFDVLEDPRVSNGVLHELARGRGIITSDEYDRKQLCRLLVRAPFSLAEIKLLADIVAHQDRLPKPTTCRVPLASSADEVEKTLQSLKDARTSNERETYDWKKQGDNVVVTVEHVASDPGKSTIYQRTLEKFSIEINLGKDQVTLQHSHTKRAQEVVKQFVRTLKQTPDNEEPPINQISLTGVTDAILRTEFFTGLPSFMPGYRLIDVLDVGVHRLGEGAATKKAPGSAQKEDDSETAEEHEVKSMIKSAAFKGVNVLQSDLYQQLQKRGFYLTRVLWSATESSSDGRHFVMEAGFANEADATDFVYDLKRILMPESIPTDGRTLKQMVDAARPGIQKLIMNAAYSSHAAISGKIGKK